MSWVLIQNSLLVGLATAAIATLLGALAALCAVMVPPPARAGVRAGAVLAFALPPFLITNTWLNYFGLTGTFRPYLNFDIYSLPGTILLLTLMLWPIAFVLLEGRFAAVQSVYFEQESLLRGWNGFRHVLWPHARGQALLALVLIFVLAINNFSVPVLLQTKVFSEEVWLTFSTKLDYAAALAVSWPLFAGPLALLAILHFRPVPFQYRTAGAPASMFRERLGTGFFGIVLAATILLLAVCVALPLYQLLTSARTWSEFLPSLAAGKVALKNSILFAAGSALLVVAIAAMTHRVKAMFLAWMAFLAPGVILAMGIIYTFNRGPVAWFYHGIGIVLFSFTLRYLALGWTGVRRALQSTDPLQREMVKVFGGNRWSQFRLAEWPQVKNSLLALFYIVFIFCLWEVETLILIVPPGSETLSLRIFNMLHYGHAAQVDALCVWLLIAAMAPLLLWGGLSLIRRGGRGAALGLVLVPMLAAGCSKPAANVAQLDSQLFASVQVIGKQGRGAGEFNKPRSLALDNQDNLYVVDLTGRVQKFTPEGQFVLQWQMPETDIGKPKGMIQDKEGNVIVVEPHYSRVNHFDQNGRLLAQWGVHGTNESQLTFPRCAAVNSRGDIYVAEYGLAERVQYFSHNGKKFLGWFGKPGTAPGDLNRGEGIGIDKHDLVYVADSCNHRVQIFSPEGKFLEAFGTPGNGLGQMSYPYDIRVDELGYRFVCEFGNSRVQIFDSNNKPLEAVGGAGVDAGQMNNPWSIALDSQGNMYVADSMNHRVQKFIRREPYHITGKISDNNKAAKFAALK